MRAALHAPKSLRAPPPTNPALQEAFAGENEEEVPVARRQRRSAASRRQQALAAGAGTGGWTRTGAGGAAGLMAPDVNLM